MIFLEETPVAIATNVFEQMEAAPDNPSLTEPLDVGSAYPPGYRPIYAWTDLIPLGYASDSLGTIVGSTQAGATATIALPTGGYQTGWCASFLATNYPALQTGPVNWSALRFFSELFPMSDGLVLANDAEARPGYQANWARVQRFPRPLAGETPATASYVSLAVCTEGQRAQINAEHSGGPIAWSSTLPDAPGGP